MVSRNSDESIQDCVEIIDLLENIHKKYTVVKPSRFDEQGNPQSIHINYDGEKINNFLNQIIDEGYIQKIANSNNQELISKFYKTLQNLYEILNRQIGGISNVTESLLIKMRGSFCSELPAGNKTKIEIEHNIQIIEKRRLEVDEKNRIAEQQELRIQKRNRNIIKIVLLLLAVFLYLIWGERIAIGYLIIYFLVFGIRQLNKLKGKQKKNSTTSANDANISIENPRKTKKQTSKEILLLALDKAEEELNNYSFDLIRVHFEKAIKGDADKILKWIQEYNSTPLAWIYSKTSNISGDMVESGNFHIYRNALNETGQQLLKLFDDSTNKLCELGEIEKDYAKRQKENIRKNIKGLG